MSHLDITFLYLSLGYMLISNFYCMCRAKLHTHRRTILVKKEFVYIETISIYDSYDDCEYQLVQKNVCRPTYKTGQWRKSEERSQYEWEPNKFVITWIFDYEVCKFITYKLQDVSKTVVLHSRPIRAKIISTTYYLLNSIGHDCLKLFLDTAM